MTTRSESIIEAAGKMGVHTIDGKNKRVTVLFQGGFGMSSLEMTLTEYGRKPYAQYAAVPYYKGKKKGARKLSGTYRTDGFLVIVEGWNHEKYDIWTKVGDGVKTASFGDTPMEKVEQFIKDNNLKVIAKYG